MVRFGNFEVEYNRNAPDKVSVRIETDEVAEMRHRTGVWRVCTVGKCRTEIPCKNRRL